MLRAWTVLVAGLLTTLALGGLAGAAPPDRDDGRFFVFSDEGQFVIPAGDACEFAVIQYYTGWGRFHLMPGGSGIAETAQFHFKLLWENPLNGKTSDVTIGETNRVVFNDDGSVTVFVSGLTGRDTIPGTGIIVGDIGRIVLTFPAGGGDPSIDFIAGRFHTFGPFPELCAYLA
jgi:hypothetical protein